MSIAARIGFGIMTLGFLFNFLETWYFGWSWKPTCVAEQMCNNVCWVMIIIGFGMTTYYAKGAY